MTMPSREIQGNPDEATIRQERSSGEQHSKLLSHYACHMQFVVFCFLTRPLSIRFLQQYLVQQLTCKAWRRICTALDLGSTSTKPHSRFNLFTFSDNKNLCQKIRLFIDSVFNTRMA
jgi:hypothetical protein